jgi:hypothetical protein
MFQRRYVALCLQLSRETYSKFITKNEIRTMRTTVDIRRDLKPVDMNVWTKGLQTTIKNV